MKKKILAITLCIAMLAIAIVGGTLAYFTDTDEKTNTFTVGNVGIVLTEPKWDATGAMEALDAYPGEPLAKDPTVTNDGKNPCFVRLEVTGLDQFVAEYGEDAMIKYRTDYVVDVLGTNWVLHDDGYYYHTVVLQPGETTDALFDQIVIPTQLTNDEETIDIVVKAYAVQAQGARPSFSAVQAMTVDEIAAWMDECLGTGNAQ